MTTIVYHKGELASDSKIGRHVGTSVQQFTYGEKVFTSPCGRCYIAKPGDMYSVEALTEMVPKLLADIGKFLERPDGGRMHPALRDYREEILVVTRDGAYHLESGRLSIIEGEDFLAMGSGWNYAKAAVIAGKSVTEAVAHNLLHDPLSGGDIWHYKAKDLKPLVEPTPVVKPEKPAKAVKVTKATGATKPAAKPRATRTPK